MIRESAWKKEQSILEQDASNLSILKKEISKQSEIDASVQLSISEKIETLKQNATLLAKKLENEKHKNLELETIIGHIRNAIEREKMQEASFRDSSSFESLAGLEGRFKKLEYDLGQLNGKANRIAENVDDKKLKINQNRTERVIDSGIFRNIEKELIESELKFKKLLIEKIKYQKQYQKLLTNYEGLKQHAQSYNEQRDSVKPRPGRSETSLVAGESISSPKKFIHLEVGKDSVNQKPRSLMRIDQESDFEQQKQILAVKKLLVETRLESCEELLSSFFNIDEVNDRYFNEMTVYTDQSNEIERYLSETSRLKNDNGLHFYQTQRQPSKNQALKSESKRLKTILEEEGSKIKSEMNEIITLFSENNFKKFLQCFGLTTDALTDGEAHFDELKDVLQGLQSHMHSILSKPSMDREDKLVPTSRSNQNEKLEELISKVRKSDQNLKVMKKQEFQEEYHKIIKSSASKTSLLKLPPKRQSSNANRK